MKKKQKVEYKRIVCPKGTYPRIFETRMEKGRNILYIYFEPAPMLKNIKFNL